MNIGFHISQLSYRGSERSIYDYAHYNEKLLGNKSVIISDLHSSHGLEALPMFENRFPTELYENFCQVNDMVFRHRLDAIFYSKSGINDGKIINGIKNWVQCVFRFNQPHGDKYFYCSKWLANHMGSDKYLPYICVPLPETKENYRQQLGIPMNATVFGYHGGKDSMNIEFVHRTVDKVAREHPEIYFVFMNINPFSTNTTNIIHIDPTYDLLKKRKFINTLDGFLYARLGGETFGLSIAEASMAGKPCIIYKHSPERNHIDNLKELGYYYENETDLEYLLTAKWYDSNAHDVYSKPYAPEIVMQQFYDLLIK